MMQRVVRLVYITVAVLSLHGLLAAASAEAQSLQSAHYRFDETSIGSGGLIRASSGDYQVGVALGDTAIGTATSPNYQVEAGSKTTNDPALSFIIDNGNANFGSFSPTATATAMSTFSVSNYTSYGYIVQVSGAPPKYSNHTIAAMATAGAPQTGTEQFGINLVANTVPGALGADPNHGQFGVGTAAPNYATPNKYRFVDGDTIAIGPKSSGLTTYTISYVVDVSSLTPGGQYKDNLSLICVGTF